MLDTICFTNTRRETRRHLAACSLTRAHRFTHQHKKVLRFLLRKMISRVAQTARTDSVSYTGEGAGMGIIRSGFQVSPCS